MSVFIVNPLSKHDFAHDPTNDFLCSICHRPRAMHVGPPFVTIPSNLDPGTMPIKSQRFTFVCAGKRLTDAKIAEYEAMGWYQAEVKSARLARSSKKREHFHHINGRMVYCP